ncbi:hypothetical protein JW921_04335, partial [Candidatus Fermentibacterales bacterium]|nr:hypothetical protein [Candidatus Fermentibacterales bacterium]
MKSLRKRACFLGRVLALSPFLFPTDPVEPQDAHGSPDRLARSVVTGDGSRAEVITADTVLATGEMSIEYAVEGLAHTGPSGRDTLLWLAGTPGDVVRQLLDSGMMAYSERRSLR